MMKIKTVEHHNIRCGILEDYIQRDMKTLKLMDNNKQIFGTLEVFVSI